MALYSGIQFYFVLGGGGESNPIFAHGKMWIYGKKEKSFHFPLFPYTFFPFFPMGKNGKTHIFPWAKMGLDPPVLYHVIHFNTINIMSAGWCSGFTIASCAEGSGFYPRLMQVV